MLTFTDIFCGAGGSSIGLTEAGLELKLAANHWDRAIETHSANFRDADHLCADVNNYDMRRLPKTDVLWASPICTEISPAGGRRRRRAPGQLDLLEEAGYVSPAALDRTRATFHDVIRATEVHRYNGVLIENVVEAADWELFDWWLSGMRLLGYRHQTVCVSSAHVGGPGNPWAPQWRDRLYIVFTREGIPMPDVEPRPLAWCPACDQDVAAFQSWKNPRGRRIGKYRAQYVYRCPNTGCQHAVVEPYVAPAAAAIDWTDLGTRIGDRSRPLAENTLRRIRAGLEMFVQPALVAAGGNTWERPGSGYVRAWPALDGPMMARTGTPGDGLACPPMVVPSGGTWNDTPATALEPFRTRTARETDGLVVAEPFITVLRRHATAQGLNDPLATVTTGGERGGGHQYLTVPEPFIAMLRGNANPRGVDEPMNTVMSGRNHALIGPPGAFYVKNYGGNAQPGDMVKDLDQPLGAVTTKDHHALVIPYRRTNRPTQVTEPLGAVSTREHAGLLHTAVAVEDCHFRMLKPREHLRAQRFPDDYVVTGNKGEQTMQAGNAVSANVAHWLGTRVAAALDGRAV